ncbi:MAG: hypothetical protein ACRD3O_13440 [Terriglobia bacterium]
MGKIRRREQFAVRGAGRDNPLAGGKMDWTNLRAWLSRYRVESSG